MTFIPFIVCLLLLGSFYRLEIILYSTQLVKIFFGKYFFIELAGGKIHRWKSQRNSSQTDFSCKHFPRRQNHFRHPAMMKFSFLANELSFFLGFAFVLFSRLSPLESRDCLFPPRQKLGYNGDSEMKMDLITDSGKSAGNIKNFKPET